MNFKIQMVIQKSVLDSSKQEIRTYNRQTDFGDVPHLIPTSRLQRVGSIDNDFQNSGFLITHMATNPRTSRFLGTTALWYACELLPVRNGMVRGSSFLFLSIRVTARVGHRAEIRKQRSHTTQPSVRSLPCDAPATTGHIPSIVFLESLTNSDPNLFASS